MALLSAGLGVLPRSALAQANASNKASAEALFNEGRKLVGVGDYAAACPKFEASQKLDPGVGTMLNLADCYEKRGQTASAWAVFREAIPAARATGSAEREELARKRAEALELKLSKLTIVVADASVRVTHNGASVDPGAFGSSIPVDPGKHLIQASAPGRKAWSQAIEVRADAQSVSVDVPALLIEDAGASGEPPRVDISTPPENAASGSSQRTFAIVAGGVGIVGVAAGTFFGLKAASEQDDAKKTCDDYPYECTKEGKSLGDDAKSHANFSTVGFIVGAAGLVGGAVLWFSAPDVSEEASLALGVGPSRLLVRGRF